MATTPPGPVQLPRWVSVALALIAALTPVFAILQAMGFSAANHAADIGSNVSKTAKDIRQCVHQLGDEQTGAGAECNLDQIVGDVQATKNQLNQLPAQVGADLNQLRGQLSPDQLQRLLQLAVERGIKVPAGPPGPQGPPGPAAPATTTTTGRPAASSTSTTTTAPPASTTTTTRPRPSTSTTTTTRPPCDPVQRLLGRCT